MQNFIKVLILFLLVSVSWAQSNTPTFTPTPTSTPLSLLLPAPNTSDFNLNPNLYQLWHFNPASNQWSQLTFSSYQKNTAIGLLAPVSTFSGQYAVTRTNNPPTSDYFGPLPQSGTLVVAGNITINVSGSTKNVKLQFVEAETGEITCGGFSFSLNPGSYLIQINNPSCLNLTAGEYLVAASINGVNFYSNQLVLLPPGCQGCGS